MLPRNSPSQSHVGSPEVSGRGAIWKHDRLAGRFDIDQTACAASHTCADDEMESSVQGSCPGAWLDGAELSDRPCCRQTVDRRGIVGRERALTGRGRRSEHSAPRNRTKATREARDVNRRTPYGQRSVHKRFPGATNDRSPRVFLPGMAAAAAAYRRTRRARTWTADRPHGTPEHDSFGKNLQAGPEHGSTIGLEHPSGGTADPDAPRSAAFCCYWRRPVTPEAAGSCHLACQPARVPASGYLV
jgi:hypothetical protein